MVGKHRCPNCDSLMGDGDLCPECPHDDGDDECECQYCEDLQVELEGEGV